MLTNSQYPDNALSCIVWLNPNRKIHPNARLLETLTSDTTPPSPLAFPTEEIRESGIFPEETCYYAHSAFDIEDHLINSTQQNPLIIPITLALQAFGWPKFEFSHFLLDSQ